MPPVRGCAAPRLQQLTDVRSQRMNALRNQHVRNRGLLEAAEWIDSKRTAGAFRGPVYGPIACEVNVHSLQHSQYLEQQCAASLWAVRHLAAPICSAPLRSAPIRSGAIRSAAVPLPAA